MVSSPDKRRYLPSWLWADGVKEVGLPVIESQLWVWAEGLKDPGFPAISFQEIHWLVTSVTLSGKLAKFVPLCSKTRTPLEPFKVIP